MPDSPIPELLRALAEEFAVLLSQLPKDQAGSIAAKRKLRMPTSEEAKALHALFGRRENTLWSMKEIAAFLAAVRTGSMTLEHIELVGKYRAIELSKGENGFCRRTLEATLNNWQGEIEKAQAAPEIRRAEKAKAKPANVVPMQQPDEAAAAKVRAAAAAGELSRGIGQ